MALEGRKKEVWRKSFALLQRYNAGEITFEEYLKLLKEV